MSAWAVQALGGSTVLMASVLALRGLAARMVGARATYALWSLPALRMAMPALPARLVPAWCVPGFLARSVDGEGLGRILATLGALVADVSVQRLALIVWLSGALLWFAWQMGLYRRFMETALRHAQAAPNAHGLQVMQTTGVTGPVAAGILHRLVFLPADFTDRYTAAERRLAILHEAVHHWRFDIIANFLGLIVHALHWWNPLAHRAYRAYRADQERACDATVLTRLRSTERHIYGAAMIKSASRRMPGIACALNNKEEIRERLLCLAEKPVSRMRHAVGGAVALVAVGTGLIATARPAPSAPNAVISYEQKAPRSDFQLAIAKYGEKARLRQANCLPAPIRKRAFYDI